MARDGMRDRAIGESAVRDPGVVEPCEVVPVPGEAFAASSLLPAEDVGGGCLLPEGPLSQHDGRSRSRKQKVGQKRSGIAFDRPEYPGFRPSATSSSSIASSRARLALSPTLRAASIRMLQDLLADELSLAVAVGREPDPLRRA